MKKRKHDQEMDDKEVGSVNKTTGKICKVTVGLLTYITNSAR